MRCVSEFDEVAAASKEGSEEDDDEAQLAPTMKGTPPMPNPLCNAGMRSTHVRALRLEADLQAMRLILGRLMAHPNNKKGIFNVPVDAKAFGLVDYHLVIKKPMDLGTVKSRLYSIAYLSREEVAEDIWLVFENAVTYNPPKNAVHMLARSLREYFDELYVAVGGEKKCEPEKLDTMDDVVAVAPPSLARRVSFAQHASVHTGESIKVDTVGLEVAAPENEQTPNAATGSNDQATISVSSSMENLRTQDAANVLSDSPQSTRRRTSITSWASTLASTAEVKQPLRRRRLSLACNKKTSGHSCRECVGRSCGVCQQGCLPLEPTLLVCNGGGCAGARIRKGSTYFIAKDGSHQYCQRCFTSLPPVLSGDHDAVRYKRDLLKRKNDEELVEEWLTCNRCDVGVHKICALHNSFVHSEDDFVCPDCVGPSVSMDEADSCSPEEFGDVYTFVTGSEAVVPMRDIADSSFKLGNDILTAEAIAKTDVSSFVEQKVRERLMKTCDIPNVEKTVSVRVISDCERFFQPPEAVRRHFRMATEGSDDDDVVSPPVKVNYKSKAIALFQKNDGLDVCIFCMYVQEYEGNDEYEEAKVATPRPTKRVYIAYLDSVEHFRPRPARTTVYHELLVSYLASARIRGFESAHIWACPPSRGNSFVFWNHPASQRTPTKELLISWYNKALSRAIECGVVTDVKSLYESEFHLQEAEQDNSDEDVSLHPSGKMICPPLLEGDFWMNEAVRIHAASLARQPTLKTKPQENNPVDAVPTQVVELAWDPCPARQIGSLLVDHMMPHASSAPFRRPVNAAAMKLDDYHKIISKPMDLGTVYSRCIHGEYLCLGDLVEDVKLVFSNAKLFNPAGHFVHNMAMEMETMFFVELENITMRWGNRAITKSLQDFSTMRMSLDMRLEMPDSADSDVSSAADATPEEMSICKETPGKPFEISLSGTDFPSDDPLVSTSIESPMNSNTRPFPEHALLTGGPDAVSQRMVGEDKWLVDKKSPVPPKRPSNSKKASGKKRRASASGSSCSVTATSEDEPSSKRRRQTWLGEEVSASVRAMRTSFFACSLVPKNAMSKQEKEKSALFSEYGRCYPSGAAAGTPSCTQPISSSIADARHTFLEFSQYRNLEFATLRHAKYSTSVLLYHLQNKKAPGVVPVCTSCNQETRECRWHKVVKVEELRKGPLKNKRKPGRPVLDCDKSKYNAEELCNDCHAKHPKQDLFIPLSVSLISK